MNTPTTVINTMDEDLLPFFDLAKQNESNPLEASEALQELLNIERRYHSSEAVNEGGMKYIFSAKDAYTQRTVAQARLKKLSKASDIDAFIREGTIQAELEHPNIVSIYDMGISNQGEPFFIMKLLGGCNLEDILKKLKNKDPQTLRDFPFEKLLETFLKVCDAIAYAHSKNILHLDLKPDNIQVDDYGQVQVCDWGLARRLEEIVLEEETQDPSSLDKLRMGITHNGVVKGSPGYMAPEQISPDIHPRTYRTDVYGLGAILYHILCLHPPLESSDVNECLKKTLAGNITPPVQITKFPVPIALNAVCMKALSTQPQDRYKNVSEFSSDIRAYVNGYATQAEKANMFKQLILMSKRYKNFAIALTSLAAMASITLSFVIYQLRVEHDLTLKARHEALMAKEEAQKAKHALEQSKKTNLKQSSKK